VPDTDGDGLSDGDEVNVHGTEPLVTDTDGDGFSDGDEVSAGSDPKDTASTPLTILSFGPADVLNTNAGSDTGVDSRPEVATDGAGNWIAVWESNDPLGEAIGTDSDILLARSTDNGDTWSFPAALNSNAGIDTGDDLRPHLAADGTGNWVAVWESDDSLGGTLGTFFDVFVARSTDHGATWSHPVPLNSNAVSDTETHWRPRIAADGAGIWVAVWGSDDSLGDTIGSDLDVFMARSTDAGATWSASAPLNTNAASDTGNDNVPEITTDGAGNWVVVWTSLETLGGTIGTDHDILVARSADHGTTWSAPAALNTNADGDTGGDFRPQVTTDGAGLWVAVWYSIDTLGGILGADSDILVARSTDAGAAWSFPAVLNANAAIDAGNDRRVRVITDGSGSWIAVWESDNSLGGTLGTDWDVLVARSSDHGATWPFPAALNANADSDVGDDLRPRVATDGAGHWVAVWYSNDALGGTAGNDEDDIFHATGAGPDTDGDGLSDGADCAPANGQAWETPGEVAHLSLMHAGGAGGTTTLSWTEPATLGGVSVVYDTVSSGLASDFTAGTCEESNDGSDTIAESTTSMAPGEVLCFLVRAGNDCSEGDSGTDSALNARDVIDCP